MALVSLNLRPTQKQLESFAMTGLIMCSALGSSLYVLGRISVGGLLLFVIAGILLFTISRIRPSWLKPVYLALIMVTFPIGWIVSHIIMAVFYYGIITPVALFFRLTGRDPFCREQDPAAGTYWIPYTHKRSAKDYFHQF
jgi:hypothetical protein